MLCIFALSTLNGHSDWREESLPIFYFKVFWKKVGNSKKLKEKRQKPKVPAFPV